MSLDVVCQPINYNTHFIKELGVVDSKIEDRIVEYVAKNETNFEASKLYSTQSGSLTIDPEIRSSNFRIIRDEKLFDLIDQLIEKVNKLDRFYNYLLVRNDITHIKYKQGDFFKAHEDYLSLTSNTIEEYTMIMCLGVTPIERTGDEGGETIFQLNQFFRHVSKESVTPRHCLIFRKDINHEGALLKDGTKEILTFNLWGIPKESEKICVITFPRTKDKHVIPYNKIIAIDNSLKSKFSFENTHSLKKACIFLYEELNFTHEEFKIVYDILMNSYISIATFLQSEHIINHYGISINDVLIVMSPTDTVVINKPQKLISFNDEIIICPTDEEATYIGSLVKDYKLPYLLFKTVFIEGTTVYGGEVSDIDPHEYKMQPVFASFSEYNNILFYQNVNNAHTPNTYDEKYDYHEMLVDNQQLEAAVNIRFCAENKSDEAVKAITDDIRNVHITEDDAYGLNKLNIELQLCHRQLQRIDIINSIVTRGSIPDQKAIYYLPQQIDSVENVGLASNRKILCHLPQQTDDVENANSTSDQKTVYYLPQKEDKNVGFYHLDKDDNQFLGPEHYESTLDRIKELNLFETIKSRLNSTGFILPQQKEIVNTFFCNESIYANMSLLYVTGFMRLKTKDE